jgi:uncharacterized protein YecE (DUF72 family)
VTQYLIGTGGWAYFNVPFGSKLKAYSKVFNFVEANYTFYEYPVTRIVEQWRRTVPADFTFTVRCHRDLTHKVGLRPVEEAYSIFDRMIGYCRILNAPFLHLETPSTYVFAQRELKAAFDFFSTVNSKGVRLAWEIRSPLKGSLMDLASLLEDFGIVHSVDLSTQSPIHESETIYTRLFGKGRRNVYQFTDEELEEIDTKILQSEAKMAIITFHGLRMNTDALRLKTYKEKGVFTSVTPSTGIDSARAVLSEDAHFPSTKPELIESQGWKIIDLTPSKRIRFSDVLSEIPVRTYDGLEELIQVLKAYM